MTRNITIEHIGKKVIHINTQSQKKLGVNDLLTILVDCTKV